MHYFRSKPYLTFADKFNVVIIDNLCIELGKAKLTNVGDEEHKYRMHLLSTEIVNWKIKNKIVDHPLVRTLSDIVDEEVLRKDSLDRRGSEQIRQQYAKNICDAVKSLGYDCFKTLVSTQEEKYDKADFGLISLIAKAAIGELPIIDTGYFTLQDVLSKNVFFLPSILEAAVAANQANLVVKLLEFLMDAYGDRSGRAVGVAIRAAVRSSRNTVGFLVFDFLKKHYDILGKRTRTSSMHLIKQDCIEYGNTGLFGTIMWWIWADEVPERRSKDLRITLTTDLRITLTENELWYILRYPSSTFIRFLITNSWLDPHNVGGESLIWIALSESNWKAAKKIIDAGVDINRVLFNSNKTPYEWACAEGHPDIQYCLIRWGADTRPLVRHGQPWTSEEKETKLWILDGREKIRYSSFAAGWVDDGGSY